MKKIVENFKKNIDVCVAAVERVMDVDVDKVKVGLAYSGLVIGGFCGFAFSSAALIPHGISSIFLAVMKRSINYLSYKEEDIVTIEYIDNSPQFNLISVVEIAHASPWRKEIEFPVNSKSEGELEGVYDEIITEEPLETQGEACTHTAVDHVLSSEELGVENTLQSTREDNAA